MIVIRFVLAFLAFALIPADCEARDTFAPDCPSAAGVEFVCGIANPEDLLHLRSEAHVIVSSYVKAGGALVMIDVNTRAKRTIFPSLDVVRNLDRFAFPDCPGPPTAFVPLGLDAVKHDHGVYRLFVTNAADSRRIEVFDLRFQRRKLKNMSWRGCVVSPPTMAVNGVAALKDGSLAVTSTINPSDTSSYMRLLSGLPTGSVALWSSGAGWTVLVSDTISGPNGIAVADDDQSIYVAGWGDKTLYHFDIADGMKLLEKEVLEFHPDNLRWGSDGNLYAAGFSGTSEEIDLCIKTGRCALMSKVVSVDPQTFQIFGVLTISPIGDDFGAATIGVLVNNRLWLGSFHGNNVVIARPKPK